MVTFEFTSIISEWIGLYNLRFNATPICFTMISCFVHIFCIVVKVDLYMLQYWDITVRIQKTLMYNCTEDYFLRMCYSHSSFHEMIYLYETQDLLAVFTIGQHGHPVLNHWNPYKFSHLAYYSFLSIGIDQITVVEIEWFGRSVVLSFWLVPY